MWCWTCVVFVLVDKDVVLDEAEQVGLQGGVWAVDERLQGLTARRHDLVAEHHQYITQDGESLLGETAQHLRLEDHQ